MIDRGKRSVLGVLVDVVDYEAAVSKIMLAGQQRQPLGVCAAASHAIMTAHIDPEYKFRLNHLGMIVPDGQPVRKALGLLYEERLEDRVYGPDLTLKVAARAAECGLGIFLYGSRRDVLDRMEARLREMFKDICIVGSEPSTFGMLTDSQVTELANRIQASRADLVFAGLGCPRQEIFAYEMKDRLGLPILAVGAAFDFIAGTAQQAPVWMQRRGLEWLYRLMGDPKRLWHRYLILGPRYIFLLLQQKLGLREFETWGRPPSAPLIPG
jgi:N-acetylglucosaminyldiphosphoundecaprenol N-acetyl-beta-D-mannosaminyltransferase